MGEKKLADRVSSEELTRLTCPQCGRSMSHGYIAGHWVRPRWTERERTYTILAGSVMRKELSWLSAPTLEAMRCEDCKIGIFRFDY